MELNKEELFKSLAEDFARAVREYRKAKYENEMPSTWSLDENKNERMYEEYKTRIKALSSSKDYISLTRQEYWEQILEAKIQVIAAIGGLKLMQDFCTYLYNHSIEDLNMYSAFDCFADGIGGWCR